ncbi:MAG: TerD family protein [Magnetococcus sp. DMHC-6]
MSISLTKGQKISLSKENQTLQRVFMGLGWDVIQKKGFMAGLFGGGGGDIDLDASCLVFDEGGKLIEEIWFKKLRGMSGAIVHTGDNLTGAGEGDDEVIKIDLSKLPSTVKSLVFTVTSFSGQTFDQVANARCRLVDEVSNTELATFKLSEVGSHTGLIMAKLYRHNNEWKLHAIGEKTTGRTFHEMMPAMTGML